MNSPHKTIMAAYCTYLASLIAIDQSPPISRMITLNDEVIYTDEVTATRSQLHGKTLKLVEMNRDGSGDCLCYFAEIDQLVMVDGRDIRKEQVL